MKNIEKRPRPLFRLLHAEDAGFASYLQIPNWLFKDKKYAPLSLQAKVAYAFLFERFRISQINNWANELGEIYVIFPRQKLAETMGISYRKAVDSFKELCRAGLIWEQSSGKFMAKRIYFATIPMCARDVHETADPLVQQTAIVISIRHKDNED